MMDKSGKEAGKELNLAGNESQMLYLRKEFVVADE